MPMSTDELIAYINATFPGIQMICHVASAGQKQVFQAIVGGQEVALKVVYVGKPPTRASTVAPSNEEDVENEDERTAESSRLERELRVLKLCQCPHIVKLAEPSFFEFTSGDESFGAYGEEWIDGQDLASLFASRRLTKDETIDLGLALSAAVEELDAHNFVHRDIKPHNIMQRRSKVFVLIDPGLALDKAGPSLTAPGNVPGTFPYISPEQWDPTGKRDLDVRSDMFPIGIVMFEALTGFHPYYKVGMSIVDVITASKSKARATIANMILPDGDLLRVVIDRLLSPAPHLRYKTAALLRAALEGAR